MAIDELRRFIEERNGLPMHTGEVRRLNFLVKRIEKATYRAGLEEMREQVAAELQRLWEIEHAKGPDDRMGDGSPDVINACIAAVGRIGQGGCNEQS